MIGAMEQGSAGTSSEFRGVTWHRRDKRWQASIEKDGKRHHLGYFKDEVEAARAYDKAATKLFGDGAKPNLFSDSEDMKRGDVTVYGDYATIKLTQGKAAIVDTEDVPELLDLSLLARIRGRMTRAPNAIQKWQAASLDHYKDDDTGTWVHDEHRLHNLLMDVPEGCMVDHINGNPLDNRKGNLRVCTNQENSWNAYHSRGVSKYKGVSRDERKGENGLWRAYIVKDGKQHHLGYFEDEVEAARAYDQAAREMFGDFCHLNAEHYPEVA